MAVSGLVLKSDNLPKVLTAIKDLTNTDVLVGYPDTGPARDDVDGVPVEITNAMIAFIQEHGSPIRNIPARPFMIPGIVLVQSRVVTLLRQAAIASLEGDKEKYMQILNQLGLVGVGGIQRAITRGEGWPPLSPVTLAARRARGVRRTRPLIDTGQLRQHVQYVIRRRQQRFSFFSSWGAVPQSIKQP